MTEKASLKYQLTRSEEVERLYEIAISTETPLHTRYDAARVMVHMRKTDPVDYIRVQGDRMKKKMRKLRKCRE